MIAVDSGFPRAVRVLAAGDFARVFAARRTAAAGSIVLHACPAALAAEGATAVRLGLSVSRRVGNAVERNRWKRRLREAFRGVKARLPAGNDFVIVVRPGPVPAGDGGARQVEDTILELAHRIVRRPGYAASAAATPRPAARRRR